MFGPSVTAGYAMQALVCLARHEEGVRGAGTIASESGVPHSFLVKILHALARAGLVTTKRGHRGGYRLACEPDELTLLDIIEAVDGPQALDRCLLGLGRCSSERRCPLHPTWSQQRVRILRRLRQLTLNQLASFESYVQRDYHYGLRGSSRLFRRTSRQGGEE